MVCINIIAADSNRDAEFLFTSMQQAFVKLRRGETGQLPPPVENMHQLWSLPSSMASAGAEHVAGGR
jgi:alkanesulfonate monooxygenase SsuD/methylene tetrahydromethanopterin reductase-like flavin-dependent oxidoreductase (luciferase family)